MQKLLYIVNELHIRGYEKLRIIPSVSPSGLSWRCIFINGLDSEKESIIASNWIQESINIENKIDYSIEQLTDMFEKEHFDFLKVCMGENKEYVEWYRNMLANLKEGELPYAFAEYFDPEDYWKTSDGNKIATLPNEKRFYFGY